MRVALLHYSFPPVIGGVERILEKHAQLLALDGHEVTVICGISEAPGTYDNGTPSDSRRTGLFQFEGSTQKRNSASEVPRRAHAANGSPPRLVTIPELAASHPRVRSVQAELSSGQVTGEFTSLRDRLINLLRPLIEKHDVVMLHNVCTMPFHLALTAGLWELASETPETRFICWVHDVAAMNPDYAVPTSAPWDLLHRVSDRFEYVVISELRQRQMSELTGFTPGRFCVIPNGIDPVEELRLSRNVEHLTRELNLLERDIVLFQPARLLRRKNVELSLRVLAALKAQGQNSCLLITGAPDPHSAASAAYTNQVISLRTELNLQDDCYFLGELFKVSDEDITSLYQVADALFFPSRQEGFGLPILEAALHRIPAFCADIEPLRHLPGALTFVQDCTPEEIASWIIHQTQGWPANLPRKAIARNYAWSVVYRNCLAPLLRDTKN